MSNNDLRGWTIRFGPALLEMVTENCVECGVIFAMTAEFKQTRLDNHRKSFHCPNGHSMSYTGKTDAEKLQEQLNAAEARETHLEDQLFASAQELELTRAALLRDRQRFANGVCPCCNRSFGNVARHMATQHPDYDVTNVASSAQPELKCSCGRTFRTLGGLHQHQTKQRSPGWYKPTASRWSSHLTVV